MPGKDDLVSRYIYYLLSPAGWSTPAGCTPCQQTERRRRGCTQPAELFLVNVTEYEYDYTQFGTFT